jgi:phenylpropionate dioxygenase-like ring-hydroxylating dioxygenase large terminal subunit
MSHLQQAGFPLNAWYAAAWDTEVTRSLLPRTICNKKVVLYRTQDNAAVALEDACWHRLVPLSMGQLKGDDVQCAYHGLRYNSSGRCVFMPSQDTINPSANVRSFPLVEQHRFVWLWPGDPALADPGWTGDGRLIKAACDYRLVVDNLMDLTHETFIHGSSIGNDAVAEAPFEVTHGDRTATVTRWMLGVEPPPFWRKMLGVPGKVDRWQIIRFEAPCTIAIDVGVAPAGSGAPEGDRSKGVNGIVLNTITPSDDKTCLYFWNFVRSFRTREQSLTNEIRDGVTRIFREDEVLVQAQQVAIDDHPDHAFYNLNIDAGAMWARRIIDRMIAEEQRVAYPVADYSAATG